MTPEQRSAALKSFSTLCWCCAHAKSKANKVRQEQQRFGAAQIMRDVGFTGEELHDIQHNEERRAAPYSREDD
jgi:hypothetical protein